MGNKNLSTKYVILKILREANEKARDILLEAKEIADESIREFQKNNSSVTVKDMEQEEGPEFVKGYMELLDRLEKKYKIA